MKRHELSYILPRAVERGFVKKPCYILLQLQEMAAADVLEMVPEEILNRIKRTDKNPVFRAYAVAHEGFSEGHLVGKGSIIKKWVASAIQKIYSKLQAGLKIFHNHIEDNRHEGRAVVGELVGKKLQQLKSRLTAIAIMYIKPAFAALPLDVASIEADISLGAFEEEKVRGVNVDNVTGIALGNSAVDRPGFPGAEMVGEFRAFIKQSQSQFTEGDVEKITIGEIKTLIKEEEIKPSDLFTAAQLTEDSMVEGFVEEAVSKAKGGEFHHRKRHEKEFDEQKAEWEKREKEMQEQITNLQGDAAKVKAADLLEKAKEERKLTEQQTKFIQERLPGFKLEDPEKLEKEFDDYLDKELDAYDKHAEIFGIKKEEKGDKKPDEKPGEEEKGGKKETTVPPADNIFLPSIDE